MLPSIFPSFRYYPAIKTVLMLAYIAGTIGLQIPALATYFRPLTPVTLVLSLTVLLIYHTDWRPAFVYYVILAILVGYFVELLGVKTGEIFGEYAYGEGLGIKLWDVPLVIGLNWLMLSYCCGSVCAQFPLSVFQKIAVAASLMVLLDLFIEPVAIDLDFWTWFGRPIPLQNYVAWWVISAILFTAWFNFPFNKANRLAKWLLLAQFGFFGIQALFNLFQ
ncbi:carotenoid biosynthesis protein [Spirosoma sp. KUDC1026]|uniref:carotenoid biosynthesis protein n=1 Tax=Spirosoma sp. KUDC1026 TaxID=2745947 RepID=UPI00159BAD96|nr:carotenoid biosynthesis protein [Spirosoma sp. KUDC1026]QKZ11889.1 carotenoid biosynthesis protein [Spirosoma sp. KUDC1026]